MENLIPLIILIPLLGVIINGLWGYRLGRRVVGLIGPGVVGVSFLLSILVVLALNGQAEEHKQFTVTLFEWIRAGDFRIPLEFLVDPLSGLMLLVVTGIGFLIHIYSVGYMADDAGYARFFTYLNLFIVSMLILVLGANYLLLFAGWELVGLCSFLLISFWFTNSDYASAGRKAFIVNRIGDFGFALGIMLIFVTFGSLNFAEVFEAGERLAVGAPVVTTITLLLFIGAIGKSAQIPLYVWLPDAMAGPTPVSALIHAATMVTAGVYMIARNHVLYDHAPTTQAIVAIVGTATALFAALIAVTQTDIKKVLAYSTVSQLGYMVLGVGAGAYTAGVFHLYTHAFFKALLFLGAGSVMHSLGGEQDMRKMGGLLKYIRTTGITFILGGLALAGIFPFAGFWSKDEILASAFNHGGLYQVLWVIGVLTAGLTAFYTLRQVGLIFFGEERWRTALAPAGAGAGHAVPVTAPAIPAAPIAHAPAPTAPVAPTIPPTASAAAERPTLPQSPAEPTPPPLAPGEKPRRPRPGQVSTAPTASLTPAAQEPATSAPAEPPPPTESEIPATPAASTPGEKPKRPRPGQTLAAGAPATPSISEPVPSAPTEPTALETPAASTGEKPRRPRPGQAANVPIEPASSPAPAGQPEPAEEKPRRPRPGQAGAPSAASVAPPTQSLAGTVSDPSVSPTKPEAVGQTRHDARTEHADAAQGGAAHDTGHGHGGHGFSGEPHESPPNMTVPLTILMLGAVAAGWANIPGVSPLLEHWLEPVFGTHEVQYIASPVTLALVSLAAAVIGALVAMMMYDVPLFVVRLPRLSPPRLGGLYEASLNKFYVDEIYDRLFVQPFRRLADWFWQAVDKSVIDGVVNAVGSGFRSLSGTFRRVQTGYMRNYALWMLVGVVVLIFWFFYQ